MLSDHDHDHDLDASHPHEAAAPHRTPSAPSTQSTHTATTATIATTSAASRRSSHSDVQVVTPLSWRLSPMLFARHQKSEHEIRHLRKPVRNFYERQNELIQGIHEVEERMQRFSNTHEAIYTTPANAADLDLEAGSQGRKDLSEIPLSPYPVAGSVGKDAVYVAGFNGGAVGALAHKEENDARANLNEAAQVEVDDDDEDDDDERDPKVRIAASLSLLCNVGLFILKLIIAITSGSLAVIASTLDSLLDLVSGFVLWYSSKKADGKDAASFYLYPVGMSRAEPAGVLVFCAVMGMVSLQVIIEGISRLLAAKDDLAFSLTDVFLMLVVVITKLLLHLYCRVIKSPSAQALAQDHRNDIITNTLGLIFAYFGANYQWWLDPLGAMLFSSFILWTWVNTGRETIELVVGKTATPDFLQQLTYVCFNHHPKVMKIDTVRAFHFGTNFLVEVDIVLPAEMPLRETHDIGESLQMKLEKIPSVERAFVHIDYEWQHKREH
eukprot:TRINITY_DN2737_c0_g1_i1.p1 TRINITY_DN2737_c0_g1~~TRINITY_DN2737_c0_g1_i1.p1  ORF type:complete len:496 (-),score=135.35 TRINITY_DN2737_c0_g1_i1:366-1853(-)